MPVWTRALVIFMVLGTCAAHAQVINRPPMPSWIKIDGTAGATIEKQFNHSGRLLKSILLLAVESKTTLTVNGKSLGEFERKDRAIGIDVTAHLRDGSNTVTLRTDGAAAVLLEVNGDLAKRNWIITDDSWKASAGKLIVRGPVDADPATNPFDLKKTFDAYNSWQLAKADQQSQATDAATLTLPPGFQAELIRSAKPEEGSWIAIAFDPQGRITIAREKKGLLRLTISQGLVANIEVINDTLLECRGLLYAHGALYANANNSKTLVRLRDTKGDGKFDEITELLKTGGGVGHGRNHVKLGPDGKLYVAHGNNVLLPKDLAPTSPFKHYAADQLIPNPWDTRMFDGNVVLPAGHVLRMNPDGTQVELLAGGFRNPLDIAFNRAGDLFAFDADMEWDVGASWYMPTRILHVVPGADFGWRHGTGRFPASYIDSLPGAVDIGLSSPTGVFFGHGAKFPAKYQEAMYNLDWAYGRIMAVHLSPSGASYTGTQEPFVSGRPLNVTDGCIGPDGAMWFTTGGRGTQSGLYRVTYKGPIESAQPAKMDETTAALHAQRRRLESLQSKPELTEAEHAEILKALASDDRFIAHAARTVLEQKSPPRSTLATLTGRAWLQYALALIRLEDKPARTEILSTLLSKIGNDPKQPFADQLRVLELTFIRLGAPSDEERAQCLKALDPLYPIASDSLANRELCKLLVYLDSNTVVEKSAAYLATATESEDLVHYPLYLRYAKTGWTISNRRAIFDALNRAEKLNGATAYFKAIKDIRTELAAALTPAEKEQLATVIAPPQSPTKVAALPTGPVVKDWEMEDLTPLLDQVSTGRSFEKAKAALTSAACILCHRVTANPADAGGVVGPDLTQVSARFNRRDLLDQILNPSKVIDEKFRGVILTLTDGTQADGWIESEDANRLILKPALLAPEKTEIPIKTIKTRRHSEISSMPPGLLNTLTADQILDMLAYFEAGGNPNHKAFQPAR